jgi:hypothetical protein
MKLPQKQLGALLLLVSCAAAQNNPSAVAVQNVKVARDGTDVRVEITLSAPVTPTVDTAENPNRILLDFPDTRTPAKALSVNDNGVRRVRAGQHSTAPLVSRVVVDLDEAHLYSVSTEGNRVILRVVAPDRRAMAARSTPVAATGGNLMGIFRRRHDSAPTNETQQDDSVLPAPPPAVAGAGFDPAKQNSSASTLPRPPIPVAAPSATTPPERAASPSFGQTQIAVAAPVVPEKTTAKVPTAAVPPTMATASPSSQAPAASPVAAKPAPVTVAKSEEVRPTPAPSNPRNEPVAPANAATAKPAATPAPTPVSSAPPSDAAVETATNAAAEPVAIGPPPEATVAAVSTLISRGDDPSLHTVFRVKYVAEGVAYLEGGSAQGLKEGMKLEVIDKNVAAKQGDSANAADPRVVAELEVSAVADTSSVSDIHAPKRPVKVGDLAYLSSGDAEALVQQRALSATRQYPAVVSFTEGDTLDEEARDIVPRPPLPSVNRARGRIGFDTIQTFSHGTSSVNSTNLGVVFRGDITRIGGTYWNLSGYWRGRLTKESAATQETLQDLVNRTYHLNMTYDNPNSTFVAGFGRLYLPYAPSLDTIDGGYFGDRISKNATLGVFGGSTPDPSSWDYSPDRVISGAFINFEGGEYNGLHYTTTFGGGVSMIKWAVDRPFTFMEDSFSFKRIFAIYESAQIDSPSGNTVTTSPGWGLGRNFTTFRVNPHPRLELDFNYNYFRDIPTFDTNLAALGLLDKYLFQGFSAGGRLEVVNQIWLSTNLGRSNGTGDTKASLNQMYGITFGNLPWIHLRADVHYAKFDSSFGNGFYKSFALSRQLRDRLRLEVLVGQQNFASTLTQNTRSRFVTGTVETTLGPHYYLQGNFTTNRGELSYDQMMFSIGYRFDSKRKGEK